MARRGGSRLDTLRLLAAIPDAIRAELRIAIEAEAAAMVATMKRRVRKKSGALARATRYVMGDVSLASSANLSAGGVLFGDPDLTATIVSGDREAWYARFVEFGTDAHRIKPKNSQGSLYINGRWLPPGEGVDHPGTTAHPYFYPTWRAGKKAAKRRIARAASKAVKRAATK